MMIEFIHGIKVSVAEDHNPEASFVELATTWLCNVPIGIRNRIAINSGNDEVHERPNEGNLYACQYHELSKNRPPFDDL